MNSKAMIEARVYRRLSRIVRFIALALMALTSGVALYGQAPAAPTGLTAAPGDMQVLLSWSAVSGATSYNVYQGASPGGESSTPIATGITATTATASGLTDGTEYYFTVAAVNATGVSPYSNEVNATPATQATGTNSAASFSIYPQVVAANPLPTGFNIQQGPGTDIGENSWLSDGGFSPYDERLSLTATQDGTATTFIAENNGADGGTDSWQSITTGYFVGATAYTYRYSGGAWTLLRTDTVTGYTADGEDESPANNTITFANSGPVTEAGDIIWLDMDNVAAIPGIQYLDSRFTQYSPTWSTETQRYETRGVTYPAILSTDVPSSDAGGLSMEIMDTNTETQGIWQFIQGAFNSPAAEEFQPGHTYEVDVWLKQSGIGDGSATFSLSKLGIAHTFTGVTGSWQRFTWTFPAVAGPLSGGVSEVQLDYNAPGTLWVDNFQIYDTDSSPNVLNQQVLQAWTDYHPGTIRIMSGYTDCSLSYRFYSLDSWLTPEIKSRNIPGIGNEYEACGELEHLPDALANVRAVGANPWLLVNMSLSPAEWGELIDYLAAPAGVGYASKRPANHPGPYTADFNTIYLEVGDEQWAKQVPADVEYGQWAHYMLSQAIAGKSYFDPSQIKFVVNSFTMNPSYGSTAAAAAPEASFVDYFLYTSGNTKLAGSTPYTGDAYFQSDMIQLPATYSTLINAMVAQRQQDAAIGHTYSLAAYEEGPGGDAGQESGSPGDTTLAAAIGAIDVNLYATESGFGPQNFYKYFLNDGAFSSHTNFANGYFPHPVWEALQMRNAYCSGPMVLTYTNSDPTYSDPIITNGQAVPMIAVYTFQDANITNQADVVVISRDLHNSTPVTLNFPATPAGSAQLYTLTGDPRQTNNSALNIPIGNKQLSGVTQSYTFTMPPGSMYILQVPMTGQWSSTGQPAPPAPASLTTSAGNGKVTLTWAASTGATGYTVLRGTVNGGPYTQIASTTSQLYYTDTAVTNGTTYYYVVEAVNGGGASGNSPQASATPNVLDGAEAGTPPPLTGADTGAWASASFIPLTHYFSGTSSDTAQYKTLWDANYLYVLVSVQDSTLTAPTQADIWDGDTVEVYFSGTDTTSTTYGPTDFQYAFPYGTGGAVVTESKHSPASLTGVLFGQQNITGGYQMAMAIPWTTLGTTPVAGQQYGFDVMIDDASSVGNEVGKIAWWGTVNNTWSNPSLMGPLVLTTPSGAPAAPTALTAMAGVGQAALSWTAVSGATSYNVYQGTTSGGESTTPVATGITAASYTVTGLTNGTTYYFKVAAVDSGGTSGYSNEASALPLGSGTLLVYEPFGEATGNLNGASGSGSMGFSTHAWALGNDGTAETDDSYNIATTTPLLYTGLATTGGYVTSAGANGDAVGRYLDLTSGGVFSSYLTTGASGHPAVGQPGQTLWISALVRVDTLVSGDKYGVYLNDSYWQPWGTWTSGISVGMGYLGSSAYWGLEEQGGTAVQSTVPVVAGQPALLVMEIIFGSSSNTVNLYVNPTSLGGSAPSTPNAQYTTTTNLAFDALALFSGEGYDITTPGPASFADLRVGTTFAAVTPP